MILTIVKAWINSVDFKVISKVEKEKNILNRSTWEIRRSMEKISCFLTLNHTHLSQPYIKSIDFLRDEGENKQNMLIFVSGCSTPLSRTYGFLTPATTLIKPRSLLHFFVMLFTWQFHERSLETVTPRSRRLSHVSRVVLLTLYEGTGLSLRRVIHMTWHLDGFNWRELFFDHQFNESKSDCKTEISLSVLISLKMNVSSAYA